MQAYRIYVVGPDGHFVNFKPLVCASDDQALAEAKQLVDGYDIELWNGGRFIVRLEREPK
jgi:hypothetical protein